MNYTYRINNNRKILLGCVNIRKPRTQINSVISNESRSRILE